MGDHEKTQQFENDDFSTKSKPISTPFSRNFGTLRFDEKSFFNTLLCLTPYWVYKPTNAIHTVSPCVYASEKTVKLSTIHQIYLNCDVVDDSVVNGFGQAKLYSFVFR